MPEANPADHLSRRSFLANGGRGLLAAAVAGELLPVIGAGKTGAAEAEKPVSLPSFTAKTEKSTGTPPTPLPPAERVGYAVVGLGRLTIEEILPALCASKKSKLVALVSGSPEKAAQVADQYGVSTENIYNYQNFDRIKDNPQVQVVYIVLPNGMHAEFTVRGAQAGKHILCEKPMANTVTEAEQMVAACAKAKVKLMIAYRIQYEPHNRLMQKMVRDKKYGNVKLIEAVNGQAQGDPGQWRQKKALAGGGALPDVGLYCLNTTRFLLGEEPTEVSAMIYSTPNDPRFKEVEENVTFALRFPSGALAQCATGYDFHESRRYRVHAQTGWFGMDPAFAYKNLKAEESHAEGSLELRTQLGIDPKDQFALEIDHMSECVLEDKQPYTPGEEGLQDQKIMAAIYEAAAGGKTVKLPPLPESTGKLDLFRGPAPAQNS